MRRTPSGWNGIGASSASGAWSSSGTGKRARRSFSISGRDADARIEIDAELANKTPPEQVREAVDICPVGTIIEKRVGYDDPIGRRLY